MKLILLYVILLSAFISACSPPSVELTGFNFSSSTQELIINNNQKTISMSEESEYEILVSSNEAVPSDLKLTFNFGDLNNYFVNTSNELTISKGSKQTSLKIKLGVIPSNAAKEYPVAIHSTDDKMALSTDSLSIKVSEKLPVIDLSSNNPIYNKYLSPNNYFKFEGNCSGNNSQVQIINTLDFNNATATLTNSANASLFADCVNNRWQFEINFAPFAEGQIPLSIKIKDSLGKQNTITHLIAIDKSAPAITQLTLDTLITGNNIASPKIQLIETYLNSVTTQFTSANITTAVFDNFSANDKVNFELAILASDNSIIKPYILIATPASYPINSYYTTTALPDGNYKLSLRMTDEVGNNVTINSALWAVNTAPPTVAYVTSSSNNDHYKLGSVIPICIQFSTSPIVVNTTSGSPTLKLETGITDRILSFVSSTTEQALGKLCFNYTVQPGDFSSDLDYYSAGALLLNSSTIQSSSGINANINLPTPGSTNSISYFKNIVIDTINPATSTLIATITSASYSSISYTNSTSINLKTAATASSLEAFKMIVYDDTTGSFVCNDTNLNLSTPASSNSTGWVTYQQDLGFVLNSTNALHYLHLRFRDAAGNLSSCMSVNITHDSISPNPVTLTSLTNNQYLKQGDYANLASVPFAGTCEGTSNMSIQVTDSLAAARGILLSCSSGYYNTTLDISTLAEGALTVTIFQTDVANNSSTPLVITLKKDTTLPSISTTGDWDGTYYNYADRTPILNWTSSDSGYGISNHYVSIYSLPSNIQVYAEQATGSLLPLVQVSSLSLSEGTSYYAKIKACDYAGNCSNYITSDGWIVDSTAPVINSFTLASIFNSHSEIGPAIWSTTSIDLSSIEVSLGTCDTIGANCARDIVNTAPLSIGTTQYTFTGLNLTNGSTYYYHLTFSDNAGNTTSQSRAFTVGLSQRSFIQSLNIGSSDQFGYKVVLDNDTLAVGVPGEDSNHAGIFSSQPTENNLMSSSGAVYIYKKNGSTWVLEAFIKSPTPAISQAFGQTIAIKDDYLVIGAPGEDSGLTGIINSPTGSADASASNSGSVYFYKRTGTVWNQISYIKADDSFSNLYFGSSVAISNDHIIVGTPDDYHSYTGGGAIYTYKIDFGGASVSYLNKITPSNLKTNMNFGYSVALSNNYLVVGAPSDTATSNGISSTVDFGIGSNSSGAVYLYKFDGTIFNFEKVIKPPVNNPSISYNFGMTLAIHNNTIAIGAPSDPSSQKSISVSAPADTGSLDSGAIHVYNYDGTDLNYEAFIKTTHSFSTDLFGRSISIYGDYILAGSIYDTNSKNIIFQGLDPSIFTGSSVLNDSGAAYLFKKSGGVWAQDKYIKPSSNYTGAYFGMALSIYNNQLAISSPRFSTPYTFGGAVFIFSK
jgi:hypothetical protein